MVLFLLGRFTIEIQYSASNEKLSMPVCDRSSGSMWMCFKGLFLDRACHIHWCLVWMTNKPTWRKKNFGRSLFIFTHVLLSCKYSIYCWRDKDLLHNERLLQRHCDGGGLWLFDENSLYKNWNNIHTMTNADQ